MDGDNIVNESETENIQDFSSEAAQPETSTENESIDNDSSETDTDTSETVSEPSGDNDNEDTTDSLNDDMSILTSEDEENETSVDTVSGNFIESSSDNQSSGSVNYESLDGVNEALALIRSENSDYYKETLLIQKNMQIEMQHISYLTECMIVLSAVIGFFVVMHVGGKLVSYFFERMR